MLATLVWCIGVTGIYGFCETGYLKATGLFYNSFFLNLHPEAALCQKEGNVEL
jgi:hypothetical protein